MVTVLRVLFGSILVVMLVLTTMASLERGVFEAAGALWSDAWFGATLADAYCAFLAVFAWIAYRESRVAARVVWFILVVSMGSMAISAYVLIQLWRLEPGDPIERVLLREPTRA
jgi:hypothetical protein